MKDAIIFFAFLKKDYMHKQTQELFEKVLDIDADRKPIREKAAAFYTRKMLGGIGDTDYFRFDPLSLAYELISPSVFVETLYANRIDDLFNYYLRTCILHEYPVRRCKNCGRWFVLTGHQGLEYCNHPFDKKGRSRCALAPPCIFVSCPENTTSAHMDNSCCQKMATGIWRFSLIA